MNTNSDGSSKDVNQFPIRGASNVSDASQIQILQGQNVFIEQQGIGHVQSGAVQTVQQQGLQNPISTGQLLAGVLVMTPSFSGIQAQGGTPIILQPSQELQILQSPLFETEQRPVTSISASGSTIHHLGQSPTRGVLTTTASLVSNPGQHKTIMSTQQPFQGLISQLAAQQQQQLQQKQSAQSTGQTVRRLSSGSLSLAQGPSQIQFIKSPLGSPERPAKRIKLEAKDAPTSDIATHRSLICEEKIKEMRILKGKYRECLTEMFFLQHQGNMMDYLQWKRKPTSQLLCFLKSSKLDSDEEDMPTENIINNEVKVLTTSGGTTPLATPVAISTTLPPAVAAMQQQNVAVTAIAGSSVKTSVTAVTSGSTSSPSATFSATIAGGDSDAKDNAASIGSIYDHSIGSQEAIVERAKQEAQVMQRISELRKEGFWSAKRLPKVQEPTRNKAHWDYLLEEMQWLAADFAQERKKKKVPTATLR